MKLLENFTYDLIKARSSSLLIWVSHADLKKMNDEAKGGDNAPLGLAHAVFNQDTPASSTNTIVINADKGHPHTQRHDEFIIGNAIYNALSDQFKDELVKQVAVQGISGGLKAAINLTGVGGAILSALPINPGDFVASALDGALDFVAQVATDGAQFASVSTTTNTLEVITELSSDQALSKFYKGRNTLNLSNMAKAKLREAFFKLQQKEELNSNDIVSSLFEFCTAASLGESSGKLLIIHNPQYLDPTSIDFLSRALSTIKALKEKGKSIPFSILLVFESPPGNNEEAVDVSIKRLNRLKMFAGRYGLLETPSTDAPLLVVRHNTFVGRREQLDIMEKSSHHSFIVTDNHASDAKGTTDQIPPLVATVVSAEPGTGKTVLCNKHLEEFFEPDHSTEQAERIKRRGVLRLNISCSPHSSGGISGIPALLHSIEHEQDRLISELSIIGRLKKAGSEFIANEGAKEVGLTIASKGINAYLGVDLKPLLAAAKNASRRDEIIGDMSKSFAKQKSEGASFGDFAQGLADWISELHKLGCRVSKCDSSLPVFMMLDDFQWLDEQSAELISAFLQARFPLRLLVTVRRGDLKNALEEAMRDPVSKPYFLTLSSQLGLLEAPLPTDAKEKLKALPYNTQNTNFTFNAGNLVENIDLPGFDIMMLKEVIKASIRGSAEYDKTKYEERSQWLAESISKYLSYDYGQKNSVNSLFTVETLNLVSDPSWNADRHSDTWKAISWNLGKPYFTEHAILSDKTDFRNRLDMQLEAIRNKYKHAIIPEGMSLSSVAVMEERLELIRVHFRRLHGDGADDYVTAFLSFSSLSGGSFEANIIANIIDALLKAPPPLALEKMASQLKDKLGFLSVNDSGKMICKPLERTYELLQEFKHVYQFYGFKHALLPIFFRQKLDDLFCDVAGNDEAEKRDQFIAWVIENCLETIFKNENWAELFRTTPSRRDDAERVMLFTLNLIHFAAKHNKSHWVEVALSAHRALASGYMDLYRFDDAIDQMERALGTIQELYKMAPSNWAKSYTDTLMALAAAYRKAGLVHLAVPINEEAYQILKELYKEDTNHWGNDFILACHGLAGCYSLSGLNDEAISIQEDACEIVRPLYNESPNQYEHIYAITHQKLELYHFMSGVIFNHDIGNHLETLELMISKNPKANPRPYLDSLYLSAEKNFALTLNTNSEESEMALNNAISCIEKCLNLYERHYSSDPAPWAPGYLHVLLQTDAHYMGLEPENKWIKERLSLCKRAECVSRYLYNRDPEAWAIERIDALETLALIYGVNDQCKDEVYTLEQALPVSESLYKHDQERWAKTYISTCELLSDAYSSEGRYEDANHLSNLVEQLKHLHSIPCT